MDAGSFVEEIVPIQVLQADGSTITFAEDEHPRVRRRSRIRAGSSSASRDRRFHCDRSNSSGVNDAAAVVALARSQCHGRGSGTNPFVERGWGAAPTVRGVDRSPRIPEALGLAGLKLAGRGAFRVNEAFAAQAVACTRELGLDEEIVNVYGSGISLGHPIAATGARMVTSAIFELRRRGGGIGVLSMCAGGGMGAAMVIEVV